MRPLSLSLSLVSLSRWPPSSAATLVIAASAQTRCCSAVNPHHSLMPRHPTVNRSRGAPMMKTPFSRRSDLEDFDVRFWSETKAMRPPPASIPSSVHRSDISSPRRIFR
ncbi:hypothetical protein OROHE_014335 [Orobanche hederae]